MRRILSAILLASVFVGPVQAKCIANDKWSGPDKTKHLAVGVAVGAAGTLYFKDPNKGFLAGVLVGLANEASDAGGMGTCSMQDFAVTAAGAAAGAYGSALLILPAKGGVVVGYARTF